MNQSDRIVFAAVDANERSQSRLPDIQISIGDRQTLKLLEDSISDLQLILPTLLSTIDGLQKEFYKWCRHTCLTQVKTRSCDHVLSQFDIHKKELELYIHRAEVLRKKAQDTAKLVGFKISPECIHLGTIDTYNSIALRLAELRKCVGLKIYRERNPRRK